MSLTRNDILGRCVLVTLMTLPLGACSSSQLGPSGSVDRTTPGGVLVTVDNRHVMDIRVYFVRGPSSMPLGSVRTLERRSFALPTSMTGHSGTVQLLADPIGSIETYVTDPIPAYPGDEVRWTLAPALQHSTYHVRQVAR